LTAALDIATATPIGGRYLVRGVLGEGGMGQVLEVEHVLLGRRFALKVLRLERVGDGTERRFRREVQALGQIHSPRVAQVVDFGNDERVGPFYVMELLDGETLEARLAREGTLPLREAAEIAIGICEALEVVHEAGLVHRDIKPSNVGLCRDRAVTVKLLDFGLAAGIDDDGVLSRITQSLQVVGSVPYMAPERLEDAPYTLAGDLWSVGVTLYQAISGRLPFEAESTAGLLHRILNEEPPAVVALEAHDAFDAVLRRFLSKHPTDRFVSATEAAGALRSVVDALAADSPRADASELRRRPTGRDTALAVPRSHPRRQSGAPVRVHESFATGSTRRSRRLAAGVAGLVALVAIAGGGIALLIHGQQPASPITEVDSVDPDAVAGSQPLSPLISAGAGHPTPAATVPAPPPGPSASALRAATVGSPVRLSPQEGTPRQKPRRAGPRGGSAPEPEAGASPAPPPAADRPPVSAPPPPRESWGGEIIEDFEAP
jgi:serine/threonine-protein kinase